MDVIVGIRIRTGSRLALSMAGVAARAVVDPVVHTITGTAANIAACANTGTAVITIANAATHDIVEPTVADIATAHTSFATNGNARTVAFTTTTAGTRATLEFTIGFAADILASVDLAVTTAACAIADYCAFHAATGFATHQSGWRCHR